MGGGSGTGTADLLLEGGTVWTGVPGPDGAVVRADALAVAGGRVVATGDDARRLAGPGTRHVDLDGGTLLPGFGDGHAHPVFAGLEALFAPVREQTSVAGVAGAVRRWAAEHPDAAWVRGEGYDPALAPDGEFDARDLDAAVPDRPVALRASDYHTAWVNTRALELAGVDASTPDPAGGVIGRRADGSPSGTLREWGAWRLVHDLLPAPTLPDRVAALAAASRRLSSCGVVWVQDAWVEADTLDTWAAAREAGVLTVRADLAMLAEPGGRWRDGLARAVEARDRLAAADGGPEPQLRAGAVKFFADGVLEGGTGWVLEPYCTGPHGHGLPNWEPGELAEAVCAAVADGFQPHVHAIGDGAVRAALDAAQAAVQRHGTANRPVLAHTQLVDPADLPRFAALGVVANFEPLWAQPDQTQTVLTVPRLGAGRSARQYPMATLARSGARLSFGSDWPVTSPVPLEGVAVAITRQTPDGDPQGGWVPHERLTLDQALGAYTAGVAHQAGDDGRWGVLAPGARADLAWVAADVDALAAASPRALHAVEVVGTWVGGRRVHG